MFDTFMGCVRDIWNIGLVRFVVYLALAFLAAGISSWLVTKNGGEVTLRLVFLFKKASDKYFKTDKDEDRASEYSSLACHVRSCLASDKDAAKAYDKGQSTDNSCSEQGLGKIVFLNSKSNRQGINRGGYALNEESGKTNTFLLARAVALGYPLVYHLYSDKTEKQKRYPRYECFKRFEIVNDGVDAYPADKWHKSLEKGKQSRNAEYFSPFHARFI